jgi:hypothetical protein
LHQRHLDSGPTFSREFDHRSSITRPLLCGIGRWSERDYRELQAWSKRNAPFPLFVSHRARVESIINENISSPGCRANDSSLFAQKHSEKEPAFVPSCVDPIRTSAPKECQDWIK